jgi:hypothetical protein
MKRLTAIIVFTVIMLSSVICYSADSGISVYVNGTKLAFDKDAAPFIDNGRTLIPIRKVSEALNAKVDWNAADRVVTIVKGLKTITLRIDSDIATIAETGSNPSRSNVTLDVPAKITGNRTYVPFRFVSENLGTKVDWDKKNKIINLTCPYVTITYDKTKAAVGEIIKAKVMLNNFESIGGYQFNIKYDPEILQAVNFSTGEPYTDTTNPAKGDITVNPDYGALPLSGNNIEAGIINSSSLYLDMKAYKSSGKPEKTGSVAIIGFKVLKASPTNVVFEETDTLPTSVCGVDVYDWDSKPINGFVVVQPPTIN